MKFQSVLFTKPYNGFDPVLFRLDGIAKVFYIDDAYQRGLKIRQTNRVEVTKCFSTDCFSEHYSLQSSLCIMAKRLHFNNFAETMLSVTSGCGDGKDLAGKNYLNEYGKLENAVASWNVEKSCFICIVTANNCAF